MKRLATLTLQKEENHFSAGHFTIFSEKDRENMHGHNYNVSVAITLILDHAGLTFDYRIYKKKLQALCHKLDRRFLLPQHSPFLKLEEMPTIWLAHFNDECMSFLKRDVMILPVSNITIEELSFWFLQQLSLEQAEIKNHAIQSITVAVYNGPGQSASASATFL